MDYPASTLTMNSDKTFKTKTGFCHILPEKIILTRDGIIGNVAKVTIGNNISRILTIYSILALGLFYFSYDSYEKGQITTTILFGLIGLYLIYGIVTSLNNSATPVIDRQKIKQIKFKKAIPGLIRSRFEVIFQDDNGQTKKRLIMLPGSLTGGQSETERAIKIMADEKLITA